MDLQERGLLPYLIIHYLDIRSLLTDLADRKFARRGFAQVQCKTANIRNGTHR